MKELNLSVSKPFNPLEISRLTIANVLNHGFKLKVTCYTTGELLGRFIPSNCSRMGYAFIKAGRPLGENQ